jgi:CheY-like chemotaxis protein
MCRKILLVEDDEINREGLSRRLERKGYLVLQAHNCCQGLELAVAESPDLILLDMSRPEAEGWEAARCLETAQATRPIPVIALTAYALVSDRARILCAGCDEMDTKPVRMARLLPKIETLLRLMGREVTT